MELYYRVPRELGDKISGKLQKVTLGKHEMNKNSYFFQMEKEVSLP